MGKLPDTPGESTPAAARFMHFFAWLAAAGFLGLAFRVATGLPPCVPRLFFGLPCPGCGVTRAVFAAARGDFWSALFWHPLFWLPVFLAALAAVSAWLGLNPRWAKRGLFFGVVAFVTVWVVRMALYFPVTPPMDFYRQAVWPRIIRWLAA